MTAKSPVVPSLRPPTPTPSAVELRRGDGPALLMPPDAVEFISDLLRSDAAVSNAIAESSLVADPDAAEPYLRSAEWTTALADWLDRIPGGVGDRVATAWSRVPSGEWTAEAAITPTASEAIA